MPVRTTEPIDRLLRLATQDISPENINAALADYAKKSLAEVIQSGVGSPFYDRYVNGAFGADEESVRVPGEIAYLFRWWREIIEWSLEKLARRSPKDSGEYRNGWFAMVNEGVVQDYDKIPLGATVILSNRAPYSRKIEVGHMNMSVPSGVVEDTKRAVSKEFGRVVKVKATMVNLPNGYILRGKFTRGVREYARTKLRRDTREGQEVTYPALVLEMKDTI